MDENFYKELIEENKKLKADLNQINQKKSPFKNFLQLNKEHTDVLSILTLKNPSAVSIFLFLAKHMDNYNAIICSYDVLENVLKLSNSSVYRGIKELKNSNLIYQFKIGKATAYALNPDLIWNSWGSNKDFCKFPVNLILSKKEMKEIQKIKVVRTPIISGTNEDIEINEITVE